MCKYVNNYVDSRRCDCIALPQGTSIDELKSVVFMDKRQSAVNVPLVDTSATASPVEGMISRCREIRNHPCSRFPLVAEPHHCLLKG